MLINLGVPRTKNGTEKHKNNMDGCSSSPHEGKRQSYYEVSFYGLIFNSGTLCVVE